MDQRFPHAHCPRARAAAAARFARGFTFVELVTVIVLMGILSVVALPRLIGSDAFGTEEVARGVVDGVRLAQRQAMARTNQNIELQVTRSASDYRFTVAAVSGGASATLFSSTASYPKVEIGVQAGALTSNVAVGQTLSFSFTDRSELQAVSLAGTAGTVTGGVALTIDGTQQRIVCVAASGYAHRGTCL